MKWRNWNLTTVIAVFTFGYFVFVLVVNEFRYELFGIVPGYAPHNFSFNLSFFLPSMVLLLIGALIVVVRFKHKATTRERNWRLVLVSPVIVFWIWQLLRLSILSYEF